MSDDDIGDEVLSREDDFEVRAKVAILVPIKASNLHGRSSTCLMNVMMQNADDGVMTLCGLAALVVIAGQIVPRVTGIGLIVTARQALAGERVGVRWEQEIEACGSAILCVGQCRLGRAG